MLVYFGLLLSSVGVDLVPSSWEPHCDPLDFPAVILPVYRLAAHFVDFLILESGNLSVFSDKVSAFHLEDLILMKCCFTLTTFMERAFFLKRSPIKMMTLKV